MRKVLTMTGAATLIVMAGCVQNGNGNSDAATTAPPSQRMPTPAEQACLRDVTAETNNPDVVLLESSHSDQGTEVIVGVGPQRAPWRCIAYADGTTGGILSLADEGAM